MRKQILKKIDILQLLHEQGLAIRLYHGLQLHLRKARKINCKQGSLYPTAVPTGISL
jgi:hypothetical protein